MADRTLVHESLSDLRESLAGTVIAPGGPEYDAARRCFNALVDRRPAAIARCTGPGDVVTALDFARSHGLEIAVRGGGHNPAGHCVLDGGLVIDLSRLRRVRVDAVTRTARAGGGSTWLDFDSATLAHGLVTPGGVVGSTGVCGLAMGGGIGHLTSQFGLTCDNVVGAELVTPDGSIVRASPGENAELLWGLRGGGGNFGVATCLEFRLRELPRVVGGLLVYEADGVRGARQRFRDLVDGSAHDLSCQAVLRLDESGSARLVVVPCYTGTSDDLDSLRALRASHGLVEEGVREHDFSAQQNVYGDTYGVERNYWKGHFVRELPDELIDVLLECIVAMGRAPGSILIESLHAAPKEADASRSAVGFRGAAFNVSAMATWLEPEMDDVRIEWARSTAAAIEPWAVSGGYFNYMQADEPIERVRAAFGLESFERLQTLKHRYDPDNVLRRNQNIPPS
jgi:FAD/FMN-containing dehydrogenase